MCSAEDLVNLTLMTRPVLMCSTEDLVNLTSRPVPPAPLTTTTPSDEAPCGQRGRYTHINIPSHMHSVD